MLVGSATFAVLVVILTLGSFPFITRPKVFTFVPTPYCSQGVERTTVRQDEEGTGTKREESHFGSLGSRGLMRLRQHSSRRAKARLTQF